MWRQPRLCDLCHEEPRSRRQIYANVSFGFEIRQHGPFGPPVSYRPAILQSMDMRRPGRLPGRVPQGLASFEKSGRGVDLAFIGEGGCRRGTEMLVPGIPLADKDEVVDCS